MSSYTPTERVGLGDRRRGAGRVFRLQLQDWLRPSVEILPDGGIVPPVNKSQNASWTGPPRPLRRTAVIGRKLGGIGNRFSTPLATSAATARLGSAAKPRPAMAAARTYSRWPRLSTSRRAYAPPRHLRTLFSAGPSRPPPRERWP